MSSSSSSPVIAASTTVRGPRRSRPWVRSVVVVAAVATWSLVATQLDHRVHIGMPLDFKVYRDAALNMLHGRNTYRSHFTYKHLNFTYPPFALLLLSALVIGPLLAALSAWWLVSVVALTCFVAICLKELTSLRRFDLYLVASLVAGASCACMQPLRSNLNFGQINFLLMLCVAYDVVRVRTSRKGVLTGLAAAVKLTPLIYTFYFVVRRSRGAAWRVAGTFVAAGALGWLLLPRDSVTFWFHQAFSPGHKGGASGPINQSWFGLTGHLLSTTPAFHLLSWLVLSGLTLWLGVSLARRYVAQERPVDALMALALTEVLVSPISWVHHWSWMVIVPLLLVARGREHGGVAAVMVLVLAVCVAAPYRWHRMYAWSSHGVAYYLTGFSLVYAGATLLVSMWVSERRRERLMSDEPSQLRHLDEATLVS